MEATKLQELSERVKQQPRAHKRYQATGQVYYYVLEPGDHTRYQIMLTPLTREMCESLNINAHGSRYHMVTLIIGDSMKSFPVDLHNIWHPGYLREKFQITDYYTHKALYVFLLGIADELVTEELYMISKEEQKER